MAQINAEPLLSPEVLVRAHEAKLQEAMMPAHIQMLAAQAANNFAEAQMKTAEADRIHTLLPSEMARLNAQMQASQMETVHNKLLASETDLRLKQLQAVTTPEILKAKEAATQAEALKTVQIAQADQFNSQSISDPTVNNYKDAVRGFLRARDQGTFYTADELKDLSTKFDSMGDTYKALYKNARLLDDDLQANGKKPFHLQTLDKEIPNPNNLPAGLGLKEIVGYDENKQPIIVTSNEMSIGQLKNSMLQGSSDALSGSNAIRQKLLSINDSKARAAFMDMISHTTGMPAEKISKLGTMDGWREHATLLLDEKFAKEPFEFRGPLQKFFATAMIPGEDQSNVHSIANLYNETRPGLGGKLSSGLNRWLFQFGDIDHKEISDLSDRIAEVKYSQNNETAAQRLDSLHNDLTEKILAVRQQMKEKNIQPIPNVDATDNYSADRITEPLNRRWLGLSYLQDAIVDQMRNDLIDRGSRSSRNQFDSLKYDISDRMKLFYKDSADYLARKENKISNSRQQHIDPKLREPPNDIDREYAEQAGFASQELRRRNFLP